MSNDPFAMPVILHGPSLQPLSWHIPVKCVLTSHPPRSFLPGAAGVQCSWPEPLSSIAGGSAMRLPGTTSVQAFPSPFSSIAGGSAMRSPGATFFQGQREYNAVPKPFTRRR